MGHMSRVLDDAKNSDVVKALAAGTAAQRAMASTTDPVGYTDAAEDLAASFAEVKRVILAAWPHLACAVDEQAAKLILAGGTDSDARAGGDMTARLAQLLARLGELADAGGILGRKPADIERWLRDGPR